MARPRMNFVSPRAVSNIRTTRRSIALPCVGRYSACNEIDRAKKPYWGAQAQERETAFEQLRELKVRWRNDVDGQRLKARRARKSRARKIKRSLSWRLTSPFRYLSVWLRPSRRTKQNG